MSESVTNTENVTVDTNDDDTVLQAVTPDAAAAAAAEEAAAVEEKKHVVKAGGDKGKRIFELLKAEPALTRAQLAERAEATTGRVGEVIRWLDANGSDEEKAAIAAHRDAQPKREKKASPTQPAEPEAKEAKGSTGNSTDANAKPAKPRASRNRKASV